MFVVFVQVEELKRKFEEYRKDYEKRKEQFVRRRRASPSLSQKIINIFRST